MTRKKTTEDDLLDRPPFPLTHPVETTAEEREQQAQDSTGAIDQPAKEQKLEDREARKDISQTIKDALPDPGDTYEKWRVELFKPGIHKLRIWYRETNSKTFINPPQPYMDDMPPFTDLCAMHEKGAILRIALYKPNIYGRMVATTGPLEIAIAPKGEYQMTGYGNPYSAQGNQPMFDPFGGLDKMLAFTQNEQAKRDKIQQDMLNMTQANSNNWIQALLANPKSGGGDNFLIVQMMQQNQQQMMQQSQQMIAMFTGLFQAMQSQSQQATQVLVAALTKNQGSPELMKIMELQQSQTNVLLQSALQNSGNLKSQVELLRDLQELTEPSTLGEIAKIAESVNLGESLKALTEAAGDRLRGTPAATAPGNGQTQPLPPMPGSTALLPQTTPPAQTTQITPPAPPQQTPPLDPQVAAFLQVAQLIKKSYVSGHKAQELAQAVKGNQALVALLAAQDPQQIINYIEKYSAQLGCKELTTTAGKQFVLSFLYELSKEGAAIPDATPTAPPAAN